MARVCDHDWNNGHWRFVQRTEVPQQQNSSDCRSFTVIFYIHGAASCATPDRLDGGEWRCFFCNVLRVLGGKDPDSLESRVAAATAEKRRLAEDIKADSIRNTTKLILGQFLPHEIAEAKLRIAKEHPKRRSTILTAFRQACDVSSNTSDETTGSVLSRNVEEAGQALQHIKRQIRHEKAIRVAADAAQQGKEAERQRAEAQIEKLQNELRAALKLAHDAGLNV
ncbi:hypothetical protein IWX47DRAFT_909303 [Phyllosticta citricarpa]